MRHTSVVLWLVASAGLLAACIEPNLRVCDDGTACSAGQVCLAGGGCGDPADVAACEGLAEGEACAGSFGGGRCVLGACRASRCGDGTCQVPRENPARCPADCS